MNFFRSKFFLALAFAAAFFFLSLSLGGEFLHEHAHHHATKAEHDDCAVYQLLVQTFLLAVAVAFAFAVCRLLYGLTADTKVFSLQKYLLPLLRAPPVSL